MAAVIAAGLTGSPIDRADHIRHDPDALAACQADPGARLLRLDGFDPVLAADGRLVWTTLADRAEGDALIWLGMADGVPHFAGYAPGVRLPSGRSPALMHALAILPAGEAESYAVARSLIDWHARNGFCANCGHATAPMRGGWMRACPSCSTEHFPRVDPVVIMLAEHDGRVLVGRQAAWPERRYSALAGFLEPGESIEEAVAREIAEEAGVRVGRVRYLASQPWPFPSSLMIACIAEADDDRLTLASDELEDAFWVTADEVRAALSGDASARFLPPPAYAIAHTLLAAWAA